MAHRNPRQEVIAKLSRFLTPSAKVRVSADRYKPIGVDRCALGKTMEGFHFLRERIIPSIPGRIMLASINEACLPGQLLICYLEQDAQGLWHYSGGVNTSVMPSPQDGSNKEQAPTSPPPASQAERVPISDPDESIRFTLDRKSEMPRVHLDGGGWPNHFHAGGSVLTNGPDIARVRLLSVNGTMVEDTVVDGIVLFFTDQPVELPRECSGQYR